MAFTSLNHDLHPDWTHTCPVSESISFNLVGMLLPGSLTLAQRRLALGSIVGTALSQKVAYIDAF